MTLPYKIEQSERKTISLTIERNNDLVIKAPLHATHQKIEEFFFKKQIWLYTKLEEKKNIEKSTSIKELVPWEGFYFLGRMYKLDIVDEVDFKLRFKNRKFELNREYLVEWRELFLDWYKTQFYDKVLPRVKNLSNRCGFEPTNISVQELNNRWGSCTKDNKLNFHWKVVMAPLSVIDYIIVHELCHIKEKNHSSKFWDMVERFMPDYQNHKEWLRKNWGEFVL